MRYSILLSLRETLLSRSPIDTIPESVWKRTGALNTWGTNAIEGNALTRRDVERLLLEQRSVANRPVPDVLETLQHETAFRGLLQRRAAPLRRDTALELHRIVFQTVLPTAGAWRRVNVGIAGARFTPPRMERVPGLMEDWEREYSQRDLRAEDVFSLGAWMHYQFEAVHPFEDGNGRVGRLLLNPPFLRHNWPPVHVLPSDRARYLKALDFLVEVDDFPSRSEAVRAAIRDLVYSRVELVTDKLKRIQEAEKSLADMESFKKEFLQK